ncbi:MAG: GNAT family N-acetyltransferase [Deltaproteobacteria bacterium]|nr:MAG: GNAT family N-acetyltransferase [Deltaproteobacteria bacterium]
MAAHISLTRPAMPRLRPYAPRDWAQFTALELETQLDSLGDSTEEERAIFRERVPALLDVKMGFSRNGFRRPGAQLWVLEGDDGRYLGHLWLTERDDARHGTPTLQVTTLGVVREGRGQNYGRLLMQKAEQEAKERGIEVIALEVAGNNRRARDLFKDLGYETVRRTMQKRLRGH